MTKKEFELNFWQHYLWLESEFRTVLEYVELDSANYSTYSRRIEKLILQIGSEFDNVSREICGLQSVDRTSISDYYCCKGIFDKMYIVFTDYTKREERRVEAIKREKDPILFGTFQDAATRTVVERFYFIGDWTDEYCDLTLDKMVAVVKEKADKDIVKKFSTPESIRELSDQLNNLDESMNGLYRQREKAPAPKKGFFDRVRTAFRSLKGE